MTHQELSCDLMLRRLVMRNFRAYHDIKPYQRQLRLFPHSYIIDVFMFTVVCVGTVAQCFSVVVVV